MSVDADYGDLLLQKDDPHPIKRHLSLYARRRLRRAISIAKRPVPLLRRKFAARTSLTSDLDMQVRPSDGYAVLPENFIKDLAPVMELAHRKWAEHRERMAQANHYFLKFSHFMPLHEFGPVVNVALQDNVLKLASDYIGGIPVLKDLNIWWTRPSNVRTGAQNFHIDSIPDTRSLRIFVALTDIDLNNGPLTFLPASRTAEIVKEMGYLGGTINSDWVYRNCQQEMIVATCKRGQAVALDTDRCLHMGSTNMTKDRLVLSISFSSAYLNKKFQDQSAFAAAVTNRKDLAPLVLNLR